MKIFKLLPFFLFASILFSACGEDDDIDTTKPEIDLSSDDAFPINGDTLYFGETFTLKLLFTDNVELGSVTAYSIDIHNNFDHHSHSTEVTEVSLDPVKDPVNPYVYIKSFDIPVGLSEYETDVEITLPAGDSDGDYDDGDYHFFISLADSEGWSTQKGLSIKILHRD